MSLRKELNNEELDKVSGGNSGDMRKHYVRDPSELVFQYNVGDRVEVFISGFHINTRWAIIKERRIKGGDPYYYETYLVEYEKNGKRTEVTLELIKHD